MINVLRNAIYRRNLGVLRCDAAKCNVQNRPVNFQITYLSSLKKRAFYWDR